MANYAAPPDQIILDVDATDDPLHGQQEGRFFQGTIILAESSDSDSFWVRMNEGQWIRWNGIDQSDQWQ